MASLQEAVRPRSKIVPPNGVTYEDIMQAANTKSRNIARREVERLLELGWERHTAIGRSGKSIIYLTPPEED